MATPGGTLLRYWLATTAVAILAVAGPAGTPRSAGGVVLAAEWPIPPLAVRPVQRPVDAAFLDAETLLVADPDAKTIWSTDPESLALRRWRQEAEAGWYPSGLESDAARRQVVAVNQMILDPRAPRVQAVRVQVLDASGQVRQSIALRQDEVDEARTLPAWAVAPDGSIAWLTRDAGGPKGEVSVVRRMSQAGQRLPPWRAPDRYLTLGFDDQSRVYLGAEDPRPDVVDYWLDRFTLTGQLVDRYQDYGGAWPLGSKWVNIAGWPAPGQLVVTQSSQSATRRFDLAGAELAASHPPENGLWMAPTDIAPSPDGSLAAVELYGDAELFSRRQAERNDVIQFFPDGSPRSRLVFRQADVAVLWKAGRLAVGGRGRVHVLVPDSDMVASFEPDGRLLHTSLVPSWAQDLDAGAEEQVVVKGSAGVAGMLQALDPHGQRSWYARCPCDRTPALALDGDRIVTGEAESGRLVTYRLDGGAPTGEGTGPRPGRLGPSDVAAAAGAVFALDSPRSRVTRLPSGGALAAAGLSWAVAPGARRLDAAADGRLAVLATGGRLQVFDRLGEPVLDLDLRQALTRPELDARDLAWAPDGQLFVLDAGGPTVLALQLRTLAPPPSTPPAEPVEGPGSCTVVGNKTAAPAAVAVGEPVTVTLSLKVSCPVPAADELDLAFLLQPDMERSIGAGGRETQARDADAAMRDVVARLVRAVDPARTRVAVAQDYQALLAPLRPDSAAALAALGRIGAYPWPYMATQANGLFGIGPVVDHLLAAGAPGRRQAIVYVGNGLRMLQAQTIYGDASAPRRAEQADIRRVLVYQEPANGDPLPPELLTGLAEIASSSQDVIALSEAVSTDILFERLALDQAPDIGRDLEVVDSVGPDMRLESGTAAPPAAVIGERLTWRSAELPGEVITLTLRVRPTRPGHLPTNREAVALFTDPAGLRRRFVFPIPYVDVLAPTPSPTPAPTRTPPATATATAVPTNTAPPTLPPQLLWLPIAVKDPGCTPEQRAVDVVLALDASTSMDEPAAGGGSKLDAAGLALRHFLGQLNLSGPDRAALVAFNSEARVVQELTGDRAALERALAAIRSAPQTRLDLAIDVSQALLGASRRAESRAVIVLLTDGRANPVPASQAVARAAAAKDAGSLIFTIGLGEELDREALAAMASGPERFYHSPTAGDLAAIYAQIASLLPCSPELYWARRN